MSSFMSAIELAAGVRSGQWTATDSLEEYLGAIDAREGEVHAFNLVTADAARTAAAEIDRRVAAGESVGPLAGVPIALKDNLCTNGVATTCSSRILEGWVPPYDATAGTSPPSGPRPNSRRVSAAWRPL